MKTLLGLSHVRSRPISAHEQAWLVRELNVAQRKVLLTRVAAWSSFALLFASFFLIGTRYEMIGFILFFVLIYTGPMLFLKVRDYKRHADLILGASEENEVLVFQGCMLYTYLVPANNKFFAELDFPTEPDTMFEACVLPNSEFLVSVNTCLPKHLKITPIAEVGEPAQKVSAEFPSRLSGFVDTSGMPTRPLSDAELSELGEIAQSLKWYRPYWVPILGTYMLCQFIYALTQPPSTEQVVIAGVFGAIVIMFVLRIIRVLRLRRQFIVDLEIGSVAVKEIHGLKHEFLASGRPWTIGEKPSSQRHVWASWVAQRHHERE